MPWNGWLRYYKNGPGESPFSDRIIHHFPQLIAPYHYTHISITCISVCGLFSVSLGPHLPHGAPLTLLDRRGWIHSVHLTISWTLERRKWIHSVHLTISWTLERRKEPDLFTANVRQVLILKLLCLYLNFVHLRNGTNAFLNATKLGDKQLTGFVSDPIKLPCSCTLGLTLLRSRHLGHPVPSLLNHIVIIL
jgi:hypothetical protein